MVEEKVIQPESVAPAEQPVAETPTPQSPSLDAVKTDYEAQIAGLKNELNQTKEQLSTQLSETKELLNSAYKKQDDKRKKELADQGQWKDLWEEANKTAQEKEQKIADLSRKLDDLKASNETESTKNAALAAISDSGAINSEQTLSLMQDRLKKNADGKVVVLNGGVEQDLSAYLGNLKNPGSGWEHHFKPSAAAGMGAKPTPTSTVSPGMSNPWKEGSINITRHMALEATEPDLAAVLKKEASS